MKMGVVSTCEIHCYLVLYCFIFKYLSSLGDVFSIKFVNLNLVANVHGELASVRPEIGIFVFCQGGRQI